MAKPKPFGETFWNLVCSCFSTKNNATKKLFLDFGLFGRFLAKKQPKFTKSGENWQNPNRLIKFSEICYLDASQQQQKWYKKTFLFISAFFSRFFNKKQPKFTKNEESWQIPNRFLKFSEICYVDAFQQKKMLQKNFFRFRHFLAFFSKKNSQNWQKN